MVFQWTGNNLGSGCAHCVEELMESWHCERNTSNFYNIEGSHGQNIKVKWNVFYPNSWEKWRIQTFLKTKILVFWRIFGNKNHFGTLILQHLSIAYIFSGRLCNCKILLNNSCFNHIKLFSVSKRNLSSRDTRKNYFFFYFENDVNVEILSVVNHTWTNLCVIL